MPDQVEVQFSVRESAELLVATREQSEQMKSVIETMTASNETLERASEAINDVVLAIEGNGGHVHGDGQVSGVNSSLVPVDEADGATDASRLYDKVLTSVISRDDELWGQLNEAAIEVDNLLGEFGTSLAAMVDIVNGNAESFGEGLESATDAVGEFSDAATVVSDFKEAVDAADDALNNMASTDGDNPIAQAIETLYESREHETMREERGIDHGARQALKDVAESTVEDVKADPNSRAADSVEKLADAAENVTTMLDGGAGTMAGNLLTVMNNLSKLDTNMTGFGDTLQGGSGLSGITKVVKDLVSALGQGGGLLSTTANLGDTLAGINVLAGGGSGGGGGLIGRIRSAISGLGRFSGVARAAGGALSLIPVAIGAVSELTDTAQSVRDVTISQTGSYQFGQAAQQFAENWIESTFTGLDESESQAIQQTLITERMRYGTDEYREGRSFATNARLNYGLEADKAARLYVNAVQRGTMTVEQLTAQLDALAEQSKETGRTMTELTDAYMKSVESLKGVVGDGQSNTYAGILNNMNLEDGQRKKLESTMGKYINSNQYGSTFNAITSDYVAQGYSVEAAQLAATLDMELLYNQSNMDILGQQLGSSGHNLRQYISNRDWDGLREAFESMQNGSADDQVQFTSIYQGLLGLGFVDEKDSKTPEGIVKAIKRYYGDADDDEVNGVAEAEQAFNTQKLDASGESNVSKLQQELSDYRSYVGQTVEYDPYGLMAQSQVQEQTQMNSYVSQALKTDGITNDELDKARLILMDRGIFSPEDMRGLSDEAMYKILRETGESYIESGMDSFEDYVVRDRDKLRNAYSEYTSQFDGIDTVRESNELAAEITLKFEGGLGEYLVSEVRKAEFRERNDQGND